MNFQGIIPGAHWMVFCFRGVENAGNCIVLVLSMNRNHRYYLRCCGKCHVCLINLFTNKTTPILMKAKSEYEEMERIVDIHCEQAIAK